ncbi:TOPRIM nucleotidyl transferase/hydrolase domain-containing protein [Streptomyces sp. NPDC056738]|uniref:TOPRIM nucleotidyl transferase/hydrolase domain-containing protein n=1 Tax=Streptomyces sp. NPDC056738 TaxID=3345933 RepID=UPI00369E5F2D
MTDMGAFRETVTTWAAGGTGDLARESAAALSVKTVVLLEGPSDLAAVQALAESRGRDLEAEGICVLAMNGAMSVGRFARILGPTGLDLRLTGLCDEAERGYYARALEENPPEREQNASKRDQHAVARDQHAVERERNTMERARNAVEGDGARRSAFFVCSADLEDELIRALGVPRVEELIQAEGDLRALRTFVRQPAQHGRSPQRQLRRFLGTKKGRKIHYGRVLVEALPPDRVPAPLDALLADV